MKRAVLRGALLAGGALAFGARAAQAADLQAVNAAARAASAASVGSAVPELGFGAVLQTLLGLVFVIAVVFGCAWLARRFGWQSAQRGALVRTVGGTSLGGKERVAVVEIGDTWLVLGAAPGNVRLLHTMPAGVRDAAPGAPAEAARGFDPSAPFSTRLRDALAGEARRRFGRRRDGA